MSESNDDDVQFSVAVLVVTVFHLLVVFMRMSDLINIPWIVILLPEIVFSIAAASVAALIMVRTFCERGDNV